MNKFKWLRLGILNVGGGIFGERVAHQKTAYQYQVEGSYPAWKIIVFSPSLQTEALHQVAVEEYCSTGNS